MSEFEPIPLAEFCHIGKPKSPYRRPILDEIPEDLLSNFRNIFLEGMY